MRKKDDFPGRRSEKEERLSWKEDREGRKTFLEGGVRKNEDFPGRRREKEGRLSWKEE